MDILKELKWKCYKNNEEVVICNQRECGHSKDGKENRESVHHGVDNKLIDIIEELYYLMALEKIDIDAQNVDKEKLFEALEKEEKKHHALLQLKKLYYNEVFESTKRIDVYCKDETLEKDDNIRKIRTILRFLEDIKNKKYDGNYIIYFFKNLYVEFRELRDLSVLKELSNAVFDIQIHGENHDLSKYNKDNIKVWFQLFMALRNECFGVAGEVVWLTFLLNLFQKACSENKNAKWDKIGKQWESQLKDKVRDTNALVEDKIGEKIFDTQKNMLQCYVARPVSSEVFDKKIEDLVKALQQLSKIKEYKGKLDRYFKKTGKSCIALMHSDGKHYAALSGGEFVNRYTKDLKKILGSEYQVVELIDDVRYYHTKNSYITYGEYSDWKKKVNFDEKKVSNIGLMFACCERKLLAALYGKENINYTIYVKKEVCSMCMTAIKAFDNEKENKGLIRYPQKKDSNVSHKNKNDQLNEIAKKVRENR